MSLKFEKRVPDHITVLGLASRKIRTREAYTHVTLRSFLRAALRIAESRDRHTQTGPSLFSLATLMNPRGCLLKV